MGQLDDNLRREGVGRIKDSVDVFNWRNSGDVMVVFGNFEGIY